MDEQIKVFVGLDTHKDSISVAVCDAGRASARFVGTVGPDLHGLLKTLGKMGEPHELGVVYEAGPMGYGLYRELRRRGYHCEIIAPSLTPKRPGDRIKNDRRDCLRLAELSRAGELTSIWVPDEEHEAMRNLWRAREDAVVMRQKARQQLKAFLLRQGRRYGAKGGWTKTFLRWVSEQHFEHAGDRIAVADYLLSVDAAEQRVMRLTNALSDAAAQWRLGDMVSALRSLRGVDTVCAVGLVAEIGDINRFATLRQLMGYLGLVPSEHSSGNGVYRGSITKTGNAHARRLLTEAAWNYRFPARLSPTLRARDADLTEAIRGHAWKAQQRLCGRYARLSSRGLHINKVCVAVARELAGFVWSIAKQAAPSSALH